MFYNCSSLASLDLSNFDTSNFKTLRSIFYGCSSLTSLNLSNFDTSQVTKINDLFSGCINLEYINLYNFTEINVSDDQSLYKTIFNLVPDNAVICINIEKTENKIFPQLEYRTCITIDCSYDWRTNQKKIKYGTKECYDNCSIISQYEYNGKCYENCPDGLIDDNNTNKCKCILEQCFSCSPAALSYNLCTECNYNYYPIENDPLNLVEYFNCYKEAPQGYYLDVVDFVYKKCY